MILHCEILGHRKGGPARVGIGDVHHVRGEEDLVGDRVRPEGLEAIVARVGRAVPPDLGELVPPATRVAPARSPYLRFHLGLLVDDVLHVPGTGWKVPQRLRDRRVRGRPQTLELHLSIRPGRGSRIV